jgi:hypothetical protein
LPPGRVEEGTEVNAITKKTSIDSKVVPSTSWIFVLLNFIYCDLFARTDPVVLNGLIAGQLGSVQITPGFLLGFAVLMEIPMVLVSRLVTYRANRWANVIAGAIMVVVQSASLFVGSPAPYSCSRR